MRKLYHLWIGDTYSLHDSGGNTRMDFVGSDYDEHTYEEACVAGKTGK